MERVLDWTPPSHSAEHFDQPDHSDIGQSIGHFTCPQRFIFLLSEQAIPQSSFFTTVARYIVCQPPHLNGWRGSQESSQLTEQAAGIHLPMSQSTILAGAQVVLVSKTAFRTTLIAQMSWYMIQLMRLRHLSMNL